MVLAGGGVAGIARELGVLRGIADIDGELADRVLGAGLVVGTSAGASVAAQITSEVALDDLYRAQLRPETAEIEVDVDLEALMSRLVAAHAEGGGPAAALRRLGAFARTVSTADPARRLAAVGARLPVERWPQRTLLVTAVDVDTGERVVLDRGSGVALLVAVAASAAVPGVWPPVAVGARTCMDGGVSSPTNADLAAGADRVLVVTPAPATGEPDQDPLTAELAALAPARTAVVRADAASLEAFGPNPLSPSTRPDAARAGRRVGAARAAEVTRAWR